MIDIRIDDREASAALQRLQQRLSDMTPVMRALAVEMESRVEQRFETALDPAGRPWRALSLVTLAGGRGRCDRPWRKPLCHTTRAPSDSLYFSFGHNEARGLWCAPCDPAPGSIPACAGETSRDRV